MIAINKKHRSGMTLLLAITFVISPNIGRICAQTITTGSTPATSPSSTQTPNGISVGRPKVFDNRTLTIMLESLSESLRTVQTQFVDQRALAAAFSFLQGSRSMDVTSNFAVSPLQLPSLRQETTTNTGNVNPSGTPLPDTSTLKTVSERAAVSPAIPGLDAAPAFSGFNPTFGQNPADLLNDQVNLTYQIFNLRMLLERSLSDRLLEDSKTRRQAVLGFNVSLDPPRTAEDAVAVVEVSLDLSEYRCTSEDCLSLVSLMPQEKTYNAAALSTKSRAFGGAAVVNMFQVGYSERRRGQVFYLYRDNDTLSYERMDLENPGRVVFGWMFRPVLGRRSVSPGLRQLFAIVALPSNDTSKANSEPTDQSGQAAPTKLNASVRTFWKKYDGNTMTSFEKRDTNRAGRIKNALLFGLTKPEIFADRYTNIAGYKNIEVKSTDDYQTNLQPVLNRLSWRLIGQKSVVISGQGNNFFSGTQVTIGDKVYGPTDGLILKSNQAFDLTVGLDALINGTGSIIGRYGSAIPLLAEEVPPYGITITDVSVSPSFAGHRLMTIQLRSQKPETYVPDPKNSKQSIPVRAQFEEPSEHKYGKFLVTLNGNLVLPPYDFDRVAGTIGAYIPDSLLSKGGGLLRVSYPFLPAAWSATFLATDPASDFAITRINSKSILIHSKNPLGFTKDPTSISGLTPSSLHFCWKVFAGDDTPILLKTEYCKGNNVSKTSSLAIANTEKATSGRSKRVRAKPPPMESDSGSSSTLKLSDNSLIVTSGKEIPDKVILVAPNGAVFNLDVPKSSEPPPQTAKTIQLNQYDIVWVDVPVKDVSKVASVEVNQMMLKFREPPPDDDGNPPKSIKVQITRTLTEHPGDLELTLLDKDGKAIGSVHVFIVERSKKEKQ